MSRENKNIFCSSGLRRGVGDDETDEDAFRVLLGRGIGIKVGNPDELSAATGFFPDIEARERLP